MTLYIYGRITKDCNCKSICCDDANISAGDWVLCSIKLTSSISKNYRLIAVHKSIEREIDDSEVYVELENGNGLSLDTVFKDAKVFTDDAELFTILDQFRSDILNYEMKPAWKHGNSVEYHDPFPDIVYTAKRGWCDSTEVPINEYLNISEMDEGE